MVERILNLAFFGLGIGLIGLAVAQTVLSVRRRRTWVWSTGKVVGYRRERDDKHRGFYYFPRIEYSVGDRAYVCCASSGRGVRSFEVGQSVPILYDPRNPEQADLATAFALWLLPIVLMFFGLGFVLVIGFKLFGRI